MATNDYLKSGVRQRLANMRLFTALLEAGIGFKQELDQTGYGNAIDVLNLDTAAMPGGRVYVSVIEDQRQNSVAYYVNATHTCGDFSLCEGVESLSKALMNIGRCMESVHSVHLKVTESESEAA